MVLKKSPQPRFPRLGPYHGCEQNYKPGSVFDSHLSSRIVANAIKPPRERSGQPICSHTGVAPDRVYSDGQSPAIGCALTTPFHPYWRSEAPLAGDLCCTFPEVAFGGCYPLSLPCGARTFLMTGLSAWPRDCLFSSRNYCTKPVPDCQRGKFLRLVVFFRLLRYNFTVCRNPPSSGGYKERSP